MAKRRVGVGEPERRNRLVARWRRSGESAAQFAARRGISQWALYSWAKHLGAGAKRNRRRRPILGSTAAGTAAFVPVRLVGDGYAEAPASRSEGVVEIQLRGGDVVRVVGEISVERLRTVVTAVREAC